MLFDGFTHHDAGAAPGLGTDFQFIHKGFHNGEAHAAVLVGGFCRIKRLFCLRNVRKPDPLVGDCYGDDFVVVNGYFDVDLSLLLGVSVQDDVGDRFGNGPD